MSDGLAATRARRIELQASCAAQREALARELGSIEQGLVPVDRTLDWVRRYGPLAAVVGVTALVIAGPQRALRATRSALVWSMYAVQALRLFR